MNVCAKTNNGTLRFELLQNGSIIIGKNIEENSFCYSLNGIPYFIDAKEGELIIGLTSDVTEEQAKLMVKENDELSMPGYGFEDYIGTSVCDHALDSFKSLMQHLQVYEVDPYERPSEGENDEHKFWDQDNKHLEAQSRTGKWIVLFKTNN